MAIKYETERLYIERVYYKKSEEIVFYIILKEDRKVVGEITLTLYPLFFCDNTNLGFHIKNKSDYGKGYMTEALNGIKGYLKRYNMEACAYEENIASNKVLQKIFPNKKQIFASAYINTEKRKVNIYKF